MLRQHVRQDYNTVAPSEPEGHIPLLKKYPCALMHLHQQRLLRRLCCVFGAGASVDIGMAGWSDFISELAVGLVDPKSVDSSKRDLIARAQELFYAFARWYDDGAANRGGARPGPGDPGLQTYEAKLACAWREKVYATLYKERDAIAKGIDREDDSYYRRFAPIIRLLPVTISFNFDDWLERTLAALRQPRDVKRRRGYTTVWDENSQLPTTEPVIFHPNGFLPSHKHERGSPRLVFSEEAFSDQLQGSMYGRYAILRNEVSHKTCLLVGISLEDPILAFVLRQNALNHPGHFHYIVHWTGPQGVNRLSREQSTRLFKLYNLISLELTTEEIRLLADILAWDPVQAYQEGEMNDVALMFSFVVTGAVGVGKSAVISHFRSLKQHDEWTEPRLDQMAKDPEKLSEGELRTVDEWVAKQFRLRNSVLNFNENQIGLHILDRGPLDPLAFTPQDQSIPAKARRLCSSIKGRRKAPISAAHIIVLKGDPMVLNSRTIAQGKDFSAEVIGRQQDQIIDAYGSQAVTVIDTTKLGLEEVVRTVAFEIFHEQYRDYTAVSLEERFNRIGSPDQALLPFPSNSRE
jgi:SIR2-like domain